MVVDTDEAAYVEESWFGRELEVGDAVIKVAAPVGRCAVIDLSPTTGEKDGSLLKALSRYRPDTGGEPWFGVDAREVTPGAIRAGDGVAIR